MTPTAADLELAAAVGSAAAAGSAEGEGMIHHDESMSASEGEGEVEGEVEDEGEGEGEGDERSAPRGRLLLPRCTLGVPSRGGGMLSMPYVRSTSTSTQALGHAGPVRSIRWAPYPHEVLASVGNDGLLIIW